VEVRLQQRDMVKSNMEKSVNIERRPLYIAIAGFGNTVCRMMGFPVSKIICMHAMPPWCRCYGGART
jgi:hypothetical protein